MIIHVVLVITDIGTFAINLCIFIKQLKCVLTILQVIAYCSVCFCDVWN